MNPKFSIIIPVYNVAPYLRECLDSILAQTYTDWECICVDDGSMDGSGEILDEYAVRELERVVGVGGGGLGEGEAEVKGRVGEARIKVIHQKNQGVSAARNLGIEEASGESITFVDSDDVIDKDWLKVAAETIEKY